MSDSDVAKMDELMDRREGEDDSYRSPYHPDLMTKAEDILLLQPIKEEHKNPVLAAKNETEKLAEQKEEVGVELNPLEEAATKFTKLLPYVKILGSAMPSQKGVIRVLHALAEFPLGASKPRLLTEGERQLFHVMQELQQNKSIILSDFIKKAGEAEQLKKTATENIVAEGEANVTTENQV